MLRGGPRGTIFPVETAAASDAGFYFVLVIYASYMRSFALTLR